LWSDCEEARVEIHCDKPTSVDTTPPIGYRKLTRAEFDALLKNPGKALVIDVRRPDEVQSIGGFPVYLSIQSADLEKYLAFIPKDRTIVTVSNHAGRAGKAVALLEKNGFTVAGGIGVQDYEAEGARWSRSFRRHPRRRLARRRADCATCRGGNKARAGRQTSPGVQPC
jgi:rhodanese-related sulfurtransferase